MSSRTILHADMNNFYASVECLFNPGLRDKPMAVCGDPEARHGIILAKNNLAKKTGVATGEAIWQARQKCPELVLVRPDFPKYTYYAGLARELYGQYTDQIEPFGLDEAWLDVTGSCRGGGEFLANEIRRRIRDELGLTVSVGVADNKIFAKLGSDMRKPDATTVITRGNYRELVWPLPAEALLYVGRSTRRRLYEMNLTTIGDIANCGRGTLQALMGRWGETLWTYANGYDPSPVARLGEESAVKSVSNSTTTPRDLTCEQDVHIILCMLAESVAARLRRHGLKCRTVQLHIRDNKLDVFERQAKLKRPSQLSTEIAALAMNLFRQNYRWGRPIRSVGVCGCDLVSDADDRQLTFLGDDAREDRRLRLERAVDGIRERFGSRSIQRALVLTDRPLTGLSLRDDL